MVKNVKVNPFIWWMILPEDPRTPHKNTLSYSLLSRHPTPLTALQTAPSPLLPCGWRAALCP